MRGIGWAALYQDTTNGKLINPWINEHDQGHPAVATLSSSWTSSSTLS